jgi:hypothetical protein
MDEMDLVSRLKDVPPLPPEAYEQARTMLGAAMVESKAVGARDQRFSWARNLRVGVLGKVGIGVIGAAAVAVAAVAVVPADSSSPPPTAAPVVVDSELVTLANNVKASSAPLTGDASLVIRTQTRPSGPPYVTYNLYTDSGEIYVTDTRDQLPGAIDRGDNLADAWYSSVLAAARFAATGDLTEARKQMVNSSNNPWGLGLSPAEAQQVWDESQAELMQILEEKGIVDPQPRPRPTGKDLEDGINSTLWTNTLGALDIGAAHADVRAGVLRLLSTIPDVTVTNSTTNGQPSLILTAGAALFSGDGEHVLTINADTALPISSEFKLIPGQSPPDAVPSLETFESSRVTVADVKAGTF